MWSYSMSCFMAPSIVNEGLIMDSEGFWHHIGKGRYGTLDHEVIPLMGIFKSETGATHHLQAVFNEAA